MQRFSIGSITCSLLLSSGLLHAEALIKPNDPNINYYGRFDFSNSATAVKFNWPGSIIEARFSGPSIGAEITDGGSYFNVEIDGVLVDSLSPSATTHRTIRTNLSTTTTHTIRLILRTNGTTSSFGGFYLADGDTLAAKPTRPTRKMEFIGDSWTAGDVIGTTASSPYSLSTFNASLTYARLTSLAFHAQDILVARGGCGLVTSNSGDPNMPARYPQTVCDAAGDWNFSSWTPDVVCIFLGINDFNNGVSDADFITTYTGFINTVRNHYTNAPIILIGLAGRILTDVQTVAQSFSNISTFSSPITLTNALALYSHPNQAQHRIIADSLIATVMKVMQWDTLTPVAIQNPHRIGAARNASGPNSAWVVTAQDQIDFHAWPPETRPEIQIFDLMGRPLRRLFPEGQTVSLGKDFDLPDGRYLLRAIPLGASP